MAFLSSGWPLEAFPHPNGIVTYVDTIVSGLLSLGHHPHVLTQNLTTPFPHSESGVHLVEPLSGFSQHIDRIYHRVAPERAQAWSHSRKICLSTRRLATHSDVALLEMEESFGWAKSIQRGCPVPVVVRLHGPWFLNGAALGVPMDAAFHKRVALEGRAIEKAAKVTAPSADVLEQTRSYYGLALENAEVVPNPVSLPSESMFWNPERCTPGLILFIGRFDRHKGGDLILDAFAKLVDEAPEAHLRFVGPDRGLIDDHGRSWSISEYVSARLPERAAHRFEWLGSLPHNQLSALRREAMITVTPSRYETFGLAALESKALGCPVVAARVGGLHEILRDQVDSLLFEPGSVEDLADKLLRLLHDPGLAANLGQEAARDARLRFGPVTVAERMVEAYRRVLGDRS